MSLGCVYFQVSLIIVYILKIKQWSFWHLKREVSQLRTAQGKANKVSEDLLKAFIKVSFRMMLEDAAHVKKAANLF